MLTKVPVITEAGKNLQIRALGGEKLTFTKFKIGNGVSEVEDVGLFTDLKNPLFEFQISTIDKDIGCVKLSGQFDNSNIEESFRINELGVFCKGEDDKEIMYAYSNESANNGLLIGAATNGFMEHIISVIIAVGDAENVTAMLSENAIYASKKELDSHIESQNPHGVDAETVGLGKVSNVSTNDQTPTYTMATAITNLVSGEKLSTAFGKISRAIKSLIAHLKDFNNPHRVTCSQLGAAERVHLHSATDITSGALSVERGGTGATNAEQALINLGGVYIVGSELEHCVLDKSNPDDSDSGSFMFSKDENCKAVIITVESVKNSSYGSYRGERVAYMVQDNKIHFTEPTDDPGTKTVYFYITQICQK